MTTPEIYPSATNLDNTEGNQYKLQKEKKWTSTKMTNVKRATKNSSPRKYLFKNSYEITKNIIHIRQYIYCIDR